MFTDTLIDKLMGILTVHMTGKKIQLDNPTVNQLRSSMMVLVKKMHTEDVCPYLTKVIRHIDTPNLFIKSLINYFLTNTRHSTTLLMLIINTTLKDLSDNDNLKIQGLRIAADIHSGDIQQFFISKICKLMSDGNYLVRMFSVLACVSVFQLNPVKFREYKFGEKLVKMLDDETLDVRECVLLAISAVNTEINLDVLVQNYDLKSINEQIAIARIIKRKVEMAKADAVHFRLVREEEPDYLQFYNQGTRQPNKTGLYNSAQNDNHELSARQLNGTGLYNSLRNDNSELAARQSNETSLYNSVQNDNHESATRQSNETGLYNLVHKDSHGSTVFLLSNKVKKFLSYALRSTNPVLAIYAAEVFINATLFHHWIFNSLVYFMDTIYCGQILQFLYRHNLCYNSRHFLLYHKDTNKVKRLKLQILCRKLDNIAIQEIKLHHHLFNNDVLEALVLNEHSNTQLIKHVICSGLARDERINKKRRAGKHAKEIYAWNSRQPQKSTLELLIKLLPSIKIDIADTLADIKPEYEDIMHYLIIAQHFVDHKNKTIQYIEKQPLTLLQYIELLNFYLSLTKYGRYLEIPDINWPTTLSYRVDLLHRYNSRLRLPILGSFTHDMQSVMSEYSSGNAEVIAHDMQSTIPDQFSGNAEAHNMRPIFSEQSSGNAEMNTAPLSHEKPEENGIAETVTSSLLQNEKEHALADNMQSSTFSKPETTSDEIINVSTTSQTQRHEEPCIIAKKGNDLFRRGNEAFINVVSQIDAKILESLEQERINKEQDEKCLQDLLAEKDMISKKDGGTQDETASEPEQVPGGNIGRKMTSTMHSDVDTSTSDKPTNYAANDPFYDTIQLETINNEYLTGMVYISGMVLILDIKELKKSFRYSFGNNVMNVTSKQKIRIKKIREEDINKTLNLRINTSFQKLKLCISKFVRPQNIEQADFDRHFSKLTDYVLVDANDVHYLNVCFVNGKKFCFSVFDKMFYGEVFSLQAIIKSKNKKMLKMIRDVNLSK